VQSASRQLDHFEIVVDGTALYECGLIGGDQFGQPRREAGRKKLGEEFSEAMRETDWPEVFHIRRPIFLGQ
jgi:hypothetical protein